MYTFILEGEPVAQQRPRKGKNAFYNPNADQKLAARWSFKSQFGGPIFKKEAIVLDITYYLSLPKTLSKKEKEKRLMDEAIHIKKPDLDNLLKFTLDAMQGIIFDNDSQICMILARKKWSEKPETIITVREYAT